MMLDEKRMLIRKISEHQFKVLELRLFLDTHPENKEVMEKFTKACQEYMELVKKYEEKFGPLTICGDFGDDCVGWTNNPWPWEKEAN